MPGDWDAESGRLAVRAVAAGEPTRWFEELYGAGARGEIGMPWDRAAPMPALTEWLTGIGPAAGRSAVVVGCALGVDAEFLAANGFRTTAFDISDTAVRTARDRHPHSTVDYRVADLLSTPAEWRQAYDVVVESINVQALPVTLRPQAVGAVAGLVAPGGRLLVIENVRADGVPLPERPPWPFSRDEIGSFAEYGLTAVAITRSEDPPPRWRAEFNRPAG